MDCFQVLNHNVIPLQKKPNNRNHHNKTNKQTTTIKTSNKPKSITDNEWKTFQIKQVQVQSRTYTYGSYFPSILAMWNYHGTMIVPKSICFMKKLWESKILKHLNYKIYQLYSNNLQYTRSIDSRRERDIHYAPVFVCPESWQIPSYNVLKLKHGWWNSSERSISIIIYYRV